jgi:hypothetical protein
VRPARRFFDPNADGIQLGLDSKPEDVMFGGVSCLHITAMFTSLTRTGKVGVAH